MRSNVYPDKFKSNLKNPLITYLNWILNLIASQLDEQNLEYNIWILLVSIPIEILIYNIPSWTGEGTYE